MPKPPTSVSPAWRNIRSLSQASGENVTAADCSRCLRRRNVDRDGSDISVWRAARKLDCGGPCFGGIGMGVFMNRLRCGLGIFFRGIVNWIVGYGCLFFFVCFLSFLVVQDLALGAQPITVVVTL